MNKDVIVDEKTGDKWTPDGKRIISVKVPKSVVERLDAYAAEHGMTRGEVISLAVKEEVEKMGITVTPEEIAAAEEKENARFKAALEASRNKMSKEREE